MVPGSRREKGFGLRWPEVLKSWDRNLHETFDTQDISLSGQDKQRKEVSGTRKAAEGRQVRADKG